MLTKFDHNTTSALLKRRLRSGHGRPNTKDTDSDEDSMDDVFLGLEQQPLKTHRKTFDLTMQEIFLDCQKGQFDESSLECVAVTPSRHECELVRASTPEFEVSMNTGHSKLVLRKAHSPVNYPKSPVELAPLAHPDDAPCGTSRARR